MSSQEDIKLELINYKPTDEEKLVIRSAMFNFITLGNVMFFYGGTKILKLFYI